MSMYMAGLHLKARRMRKQDPNINIVITDVQPGFVNTKMAKARPDDAVGRGKGRFWEATLDKAVLQIFNAIRAKRRKVYVTRRWVLIAWLLKWMPHFILKRFA